MTSVICELVLPFESLCVDGLSYPHRETRERLDVNFSGLAHDAGINFKTEPADLT